MVFNIVHDETLLTAVCGLLGGEIMFGSWAGFNWKYFEENEGIN